LHIYLPLTPAEFLPQGVTDLLLVLTAPTHEEMTRISRPGWFMVTYRDRSRAGHFTSLYVRGDCGSRGCL